MAAQIGIHEVAQHGNHDLGIRMGEDDANHVAVFRHFDGEAALDGKGRRHAIIAREFVGHGVGRSLHEDPQVPNFVEKKSSPKLRPGMTIAIEPMVNSGSAGVKVLNDGWTVVTEDGSLSAHFEHTVLVTDGQPEILTWHDRKSLPAKA